MRKRLGSIKPLALLALAAVLVTLFALAILTGGVKQPAAKPAAVEGGGKVRPEEVWIDPKDGPQPMTPEEFERFQEELRREKLDEPIPEEPDKIAGGGGEFSALTGYVPPTDQQVDAFLSTLEKPTISEAAPHFFARGPPAAFSIQAGQKEPVLLYRALTAAHLKKYGQPWVVVNQTIGDCVSHGWAHVLGVQFAIKYLKGESGDYHTVASESMYGLSRVEGRGAKTGGRGDGSSGIDASRACLKYGVLFRLDYRGRAADAADLRIYDGSKARDWGYYGNGGRDDAGRLDAIAKEHGVKQVAQVPNVREAIAAIENGYGVAVCYLCSTSNGSRDRDGFYDPRGGAGGHCTCFLGVRYDSRGEPSGLLMLNSWGPKWLRGPKYPDDQPDGSCWVTISAADSMLRGYRDSYAPSDVVGYPRKSLRFLEGL